LSVSFLSSCSLFSLILSFSLSCSFITFLFFCFLQYSFCLLFSFRSRKLRLTTVGDPPRWPRDTPLSKKVGTKFRRHVAVAQSV
jgi:hypothetical protein